MGLKLEMYHGDVTTCEVREYYFMPTFIVTATFCRGTHRVGHHLALERGMSHANSTYPNRRHLRILDGPLGHYSCNHLTHLVRMVAQSGLSICLNGSIDFGFRHRRAKVRA